MAADSFGRDTSCMTSLRTGQFVSGVRLIVEADYRRLTTPRGMLRGGEAEQGYGFDLTEKIGSVATKNDAKALEGEIRNELMKDERHESVSVVVHSITRGPKTTFQVRINAITTEGPFELALLVSEVTVEVIGVAAE